MASRIIFLDDDPIVRVARYLLQNRWQDAWLSDFFSPEVVDLAPVLDAARGLTLHDGVEVELADGPARDADLIVFRRGVIDARVLDANPRLRLVLRLGERPKGIDLAAASTAGVPVVCVQRRTLHYTAEHALLLMMALAKRLLPADRAVREGRRQRGTVRPIDDVAYNWAGFNGVVGLRGGTLGVIGLGEVGTLVAGLGKALGMRVLYHKRTRASASEESLLGVEYAALDHLLAASDHVSLHVDNAPGNAGLIGRDAFAAMRETAFFINVSRGRLVDEDALYAALTTGAIAGAGLDTHPIEPRPAHDRLASLDNVILTPHFAGGVRSGVLLEICEMFTHMRAALYGPGSSIPVAAAGAIR